MRNSTGIWVVVIIALTILGLYIALPDSPGFGKPLTVRYGLDIEGGLRVLLAAEAGTTVDATAMEQAKQIVERRVNALGVVEPVVQVAGGNRIIVELPGIKDPKAAIDTVKQTGLLEFVDFSPTGNCSQAMPGTGQYILTDRQVALRGNPAAATTPQASPAAQSTAQATDAATDQAIGTVQASASTEQATMQASADAAMVGTPDATAQAAPPAQPTAAATAQAAAAGAPGSKDNPIKNPCTGQPFSTIMTGAGLQNAQAQIGGTNSDQYVVSFTLIGNDESQRFATHTATHIQQPMAIVLDGQVLSAPIIQSALPTGGQITGNFDQAKAQELALQLRYGALPVSLQVESIEQVGASLGNESVQASVRAGLIGLLVVLAFMLIYYRIPGFAAGMALLLFALLNFALYKLIPVTLTLPAIIGFVISVGTAVDGNILIFERIKEELRSGRSGDKAIELGFSRAWPSIRDSNISTIIVALIIYFFGGQFGAGSVRGFAITLILGLIINLFTAIIVTHTFMNLIMRVAGPSLRENALFTGIRKAKE
ncbi:MAG: protein translocase subunit SecD [Chloroflexota bacterium]